MAMINRIHWAPSFKRAFRKRVQNTPLSDKFQNQLELFVQDPFAPGLRTHKLTGVLNGLWAFSVSYDCRVIFDYVSPEEIILIDIGTHEDVY